MKINFRDTGAEIGFACARVLALSSFSLISSLIVSGSIAVAGGFPLIEALAHRVAKMDEDFIPYDEELGTGYKLAKCCGWQLASAYGDVALEAIRDGAVFGKCLEVLPDIDFKKEVKIAGASYQESCQRLG